MRTSHDDPRELVLAKRLRVFAAGAAAGSALIGFSALVGWTFHLPVLLTWGARTTIAPNSGALLMLAGISLWLVRKENAPRRSVVIAKAAAALVGLVGVLTLAEHVFGLELGIDCWFVARSHVFDIVDARIRMSPVTSAVFILVALGLLLIDWRTKGQQWPAQFLAFAAALGAAFGLLGLLLEPNGSVITISCPGVIGYFGLAGGIIGARAPWAIGGLLTSGNQGARLLRRVVPGGLLVLGFLCWVIAKPLLAGGRYTWIEVSVLVILCATILSSVVAWIAFTVDRGGSERKQFVQALPVIHQPNGDGFEPIGDPPNEARTRYRVHAGFAVAILLTCLISFLSWRVAKQATEDAAWVAHTHEVSTILEATQRHLIDLEAGGQGFALTGSANLRETYEAGKDAVKQDLQELDHLIADEDQRWLLHTLEIQINNRVESVGQVVARRQQTGESPEESERQQGKQLTDAAQATVTALKDRQKRLLEQRTERARAAQQVNFYLIGLGALAGVVFLFLAGVTVSREIAVSAGARAQVIALNAGLERRVAERTAALQAEIAARAEADVRLRESEARLGEILQSAMDAIVTVDHEQRIVLFNRAAEKMFLCPSQEALGQPITRFIPQRFHALHSRYIRKFAETGVTSRAMAPQSVLWGLRQGGEEFQIEASISQMTVGGNKLFTVIIRDVTERARAELVRENLAAVIDSSDDAIVTKNLQGTITGWNRGAERIFGYSAAEIIGQPVLMLFPPDRMHEEADILARIARGESVEHFETVRLRKDGSRIDVSVTISPVRDGSGSVVGASKIARDITGRKQVDSELVRYQLALEQQKRMLQWVLDSMVEGLVAADEQGKFIIWNPAAVKILGSVAADVPPENWSSHFGVFMADKVTLYPLDRIPLVRAIRGEVSRAEMFIRNPKEVGPGTWIEVYGAPMRDKDGVARGGVIAFRDITEKKAAELEIQKLNENLEERIAQRTAQLESVNRELEAFTYSVSHDLRAPLRRILGFGAALVEEFGATLDPQALHYVKRMQEGTRRMSTLTDELLNLAKTGQKPLQLQPTDLQTVVEDTIFLLKGETEGREVGWKIGHLPVIACDPVLVRQIFQNLLSNAIKYTRPRERAVIEVGHTITEDVPVIHVRDNGVGFKMEFASKLFGVFQRLHSDEEFEGTGVGLATVHRIVSRHGGQIWARAEIDRGATFYFTLASTGRAPLHIEEIPTPVGQDVSIMNPLGSPI